MLHAFSRSEMLLGKAGIETLSQSRVAIFGIGGVGTFAAEGLARSGVGKFILIDDDDICITNINRQIHATHQTIGKSKVEVMKERIIAINPKAEVQGWKRFYIADKQTQTSTVEAVDNPLKWEEVKAFHETTDHQIDYIIDAVDTVSAKMDLVIEAQKTGIKIISSMGAGNKLDPTAFQVADLFQTQNCPLAKVMRKELRKKGVKKLKVVYSQEEPMKPLEDEANSCHSHCVCPPTTSRSCSARRSVPGSVSFVPSVAGLIIAGEVVKDLTQKP